MTISRRGGKTYLAPWDTVEIEIPFSEVAMSMRVAGERMLVQLVKTPSNVMAQLWKDGRMFSAPITYGEAGIFCDEHGFYTYEPT